VLSYTYKNNPGRSKLGSIVVRSRCHKNIKKCVLINYNTLILIGVVLVVGVFRQITNTTFVMLLKFGTGALTYCALTHGVIPGQYKNLLSFRRYNFEKYFTAGSRTLVKYLSNKTVFCQLSKWHGFYAKYVRAAGTYTRMYQRYKNLCLISFRLPTKKVKLIEYNTLVVIGRNSNIRHKREFLTTAGANIQRGFKSKVRGVAMNPVDHPHGGRTKTNSPEKSP